MRRVLASVLLAVVLCGVRAAAAAEDPPKIRSVSPTSAFRGGTVDVVLEGSALSPFTEVRSGRGEIGLVVQPLPTANRLVLRLTIPDTTAAGPVELSVKTKFGTAKTDRFQVKLRAPVVSKVTPTTLVRGAEHDVRLEGSNLAFTGQETTVASDAPVTVKLVGKPTDKAVAVKVHVPPDTPPGPRPLVVTTTDGKFAATVTVLLAPPSVAAVAPATVLRGAEADLTLTGKNLAGVSATTLAVPDDAVTVSPRGAPTPTTVPLRVAVKPGAAPGPRLLVLKTPDGLATATFSVATKEPRLLGAKPAGVARGAESVVELSTEDAPPPFSVRVLPEDPGLSVAVDPKGRLVVKAAPDARPGPRTLVLDHPFGAATAPFAVNLRGPSVAGLTPAEVAPGAEADVVIEGTGLDGVTAALAVADPAVVLTPGPAPGVVHVRVAGDAKPGPRPVAVRTPDGAAVATLVVPGGGGSAPTLTASSAARLVRGRATEVTLAGLHLREAGDRPPAVTVDGPAGPLPVTVVASTASALKVRVETPADAPTGPAFVVVRTAEGASAAAAFVVPGLPTVTSVAPARLVRPGDAAVVVTGTDLVGPGGAAPAVALVRPDGSSPIPARVEAAAPDRLSVVVPLADTTTPGAWVLVVTTSEGGAAAALPVDAAPPGIESVDPPTIGIPGNVSFTLRGRNLLSPGGKAPTVAVTRLGAAASIKPELIASTAEELTVRVVTPPGTVPGPHVLVVRTADGVSAAVFEVVAAPMPTIGAVEPAEGVRGQSVTVTIKGTGLLGASSVAFSGTGVVAELAPGATESQLPLRVRVDAKAEPGPRTITLTAPGGRATGGKLVFTVK